MGGALREGGTSRSGSKCSSSSGSTRVSLGLCLMSACFGVLLLCHPLSASSSSAIPYLRPPPLPFPICVFLLSSLPAPAIAPHRLHAPLCSQREERRRGRLRRNRPGVAGRPPLGQQPPSRRRPCRARRQSQARGGRTGRRRCQERRSHHVRRPRPARAGIPPAPPQRGRGPAAPLRGRLSRAQAHLARPPRLARRGGALRVGSGRPRRRRRRRGHIRHAVRAHVPGVRRSQGRSESPGMGLDRRQGQGRGPRLDGRRARGAPRGAHDMGAERGGNGRRG